MNNKGNDDSKKIIFFICMILVLVFSITTGTYAYFALSASNSTAVVGVAGEADLELNVSKILPSSNTGALVPQLESALDKAVSSEHNCVDGNGNVVCQVYKAEVTNTGTSNVKVKGTVTFNNPSMPNLKYRLMTDATTLSSENGKYAYDQFEHTFVNDVSLEVDENNTFYLVVWIDEIGVAQNDSGTYTATINFKSADNGGVTSTYVNYLDSVLDENQIIGDKYFQQLDYNEQIKTISFVDYIDTTDAEVSWDMSTFKDGGIIGWLENNESPGYYDLYIGSNEVIYGRNMAYYFSDMTSVDSVDFSNLDTSQVISMRSMFSRMGFNSSILTLDLGDNFDTSNVTDMNSMFSNLGMNSSTFTLDLGDNFDTSNVTDMSYMFSVIGISSNGFVLDLGDKFNTSNVTDMSYMFSLAGANNSEFALNLGDKFDTSNVTNMSGMFNATGILNNNLELDLSSFTFDKVTSYGSMFSGFKSTQKIYVKNASDQEWIVSKGFSDVTASNVIVKS